MPTDALSDVLKAVRLMGHHQLGKELSDAQIASIVRFLKSTTGPLPANPCRC